MILKAGHNVIGFFVIYVTNKIFLRISDFY